MKSHKKLFGLLLAFVLITSAGLSLSPPVFALGNLGATFLEIGNNGILSPSSPTIRISIKDSNGLFVHGASIIITNPPYAYPYQWTMIERSNDYLVQMDSFIEEGIKDDFSFTFTASGFNSLTLKQSFAINCGYVEFSDENGNQVKTSSLQLDMNAFPLHTLVSSHFYVVYVNSIKYYVSGYTYLTSLSPQQGVCNLVLDKDYNLVTDSQTCYNAIFTLIAGRYFSTGFPLGSLDQLQNYAHDLTIYGGESVLLAKLRDLFANVAGQLIGVALLSELKTTQIGQEIVNNVNNINNVYKTFMIGKGLAYFEKEQDVTETGMYAIAMDRLHNAGNEFLSLHDTIAAYRGTTNFDFSQIDQMYNLWFDAAADTGIAIEIFNKILPDPSVGSQVWDVSLGIVSGITTIPIDTLASAEDVASTITNSVVKFVAIHDEFYGMFNSRANALLSLNQQIQATGHTLILIPVPAIGDFSISAYHVSAYMSSVTVLAGDTAQFTVDVKPIYGTVSTVSLSLSGQDSSISVNFSPKENAPPFSSALSISTSTSSSGTYVLTVTGTSGSITHTSQIIVQVQNSPPPSGAISIDPLNSAGATVMYGAYVRYHGRVDPYYNGRTVSVVQSVDGGNLYYLLGQYLPTNNNEWYDPSSMTVTPIFLSAWLGKELPITYMTKAKIEGTVLESNIISFTMIKATTSTTAIVDRNTITAGQSLNIGGTIYSSLGISGGSAYTCKGTYYVEYKQEGGQWNTITSGSVAADFKIPTGGGPYCILFNIPTQSWTPPSSGTYTIRIRYSGDNNYQSSQSDETKITVTVKNYEVTISMSGLPSTNTSNVYFDGVYKSSIAGGASQTFEIPEGSSPQVLINEGIDYGSDARYHCPIISTTITVSGNYDFPFQKQYKFSSEQPQDNSGLILVSQQGWVNSSAFINALAVANSTYSFDHWTIDDQYAGSNENLSFIIDAPHILRGYFTQGWTLTVGISGLGSTNATGAHSCDSGEVIAVRATPASGWIFSKWLLNGTDSGTNNPYTITMTGNFNLTAVFTQLPASEIIVDNPAAAFVGSWPSSASVSGYYGSNYQCHAAGTGKNTATWSFNVPAAGSWQVYARWTSYSNRATNAPYTVYYAAGSVTVTVNQQVGGGSWQSLGTFNFNAGTYSVRLTDNANGYVIADAIRLVPA